MTSRLRTCETARPTSAASSRLRVRAAMRCSKVPRISCRRPVMILKVDANVPISSCVCTSALMFKLPFETSMAVSVNCVRGVARNRPSNRLMPPTANNTTSKIRMDKSVVDCVCWLICSRAVKYAASNSDVGAIKPILYPIVGSG